ncbi:hypothetical protein V5O48_001992 [Marasmius crinis-equi]|uniref:Uncharacterized protein n=1 Tax=Marasmius crinis-equi TaxID=585013 RepID=A0ABR3FXK8_9AGAR
MVIVRPQEAGYATVAEGGTRVITVIQSQVKDLVPNKRDHFVFANVYVLPFGRVLYRNLARLLESGVFVPNAVEELPTGLAGIPDGLERLKNNQVNGKKLVALPQETP